MINFKWGLTAAVFALFVSVLLGILSGVSGIHIFLRALVFTFIFFGLGFGLRFLINSFFPELLYLNEEPARSETDESEGHISIAMDSMGEYAVPELFKQGDSYELGNIEDLISGGLKPGRRESRSSEESPQHSYPNMDFSMSSDEGIDQNRETGYNDSEEMGDIPFNEKADIKPVSLNQASVFEEPVEKAPTFQPQFTPSLGDDDAGLGGLPDLDMMAMAFSNNYSDPQTSFSSAPESSTPSMGPINPVEEPGPDRSQYKGNKPQGLKGDFNPQSLAEGIRTVLSKD
jgi:hypothetical protein